MIDHDCTIQGLRRRAPQFRTRPLFGFVGTALIAGLSLFALVGCQSFDDSAAADARGGTGSDPGAGAWQQVPRDRVAAECGLDPTVLDATVRLSASPYAIVRYGKLCWTGGREGGATETYDVFSITKTMVATLFGIIAARTDVNENTDVRDWLSPVEMLLLNPDAKVMHLLSMTANSLNLSYGYKNPFIYDATGNLSINQILPLMDRVIKKYPELFPGSSSVSELAANELFKPLGMTATSWDGQGAGAGLRSSVHDMARLGLLLLRKGRWSDRQIVDEDYVYRMTHPSFEDSTTSYGYLTWVNAHAGVALTAGDFIDLKCSPFSTWQRYPHPAAFESPDNRGGSPFEHRYDIGMFAATGSFGQFVVVHRGLDLILVVRDNGNGDNEQKEDVNNRIWQLVRPALIALDPVYKGDEAGFCEAYRRSEYAPDLLSPWDADSGFGPAKLGAR